MENDINFRKILSDCIVVAKHRISEGVSTYFEPPGNDSYKSVESRCTTNGVILEGGYSNFILENFGYLPEILDMWESEEYIGDFNDIAHVELERIIGEASYKDLRAGVDDFLQVRAKSKQTPGSKYLGIDGDVLNFITNSHRLPGVTYNQSIELIGFEDSLQANRGVTPLKDIVRDAIFGDIRVHCTDPSWLYWGFQYIGTINDYAIEPEPRFPKIRNPKTRGRVCKHLDNVLYILPFQVQKIVADLKNKSGNDYI